MDKKGDEYYKNIFEEVGCVLFSSDDIINWSFGEITEPNTFDWRTGKVIKGGLYDPKIFGAPQFFSHRCDKASGCCRRLKDTICPYCNEVVKKVDEGIIARFGHITLSIPVYNLKYLRVLADLLDIRQPLLIERVVGGTYYIVTKIDQEKKDEFQRQIELAYKAKLKNASTEEKSEIVQNYKQSLLELKLLRVRQILNEKGYFFLNAKYSDIFEANTGSEQILKFLQEIDLEKEIKNLEELNKSEYVLDVEKNERRIKIMKDFLSYEIKPSWMMINYLPVLSPTFRPLMSTDKMCDISDLTRIYQKIIIANDRLKKLMSSYAPSVIIDTEKARLQEYVNRLYNHEYFISSLNETFIKRKELAYKFTADSIFDKNIIREKIKLSFSAEQKLIKAIDGKDISEEDAPDFTKKYIDFGLKYGYFVKKYLDAFGKLKGQINEKAEWMSKYGGNPSLINDLESITDDQAECLSKLGIHELYLNNLKVITDNQMKYLSRFKGEVLYLNGVQEITDQQAMYLSFFKGEVLCLNGIQSLTDKLALWLSRFGLNSWFEFPTLELRGVLSISDQQAKLLSNFSGQSLAIGVERVNDEQLDWLVKCSVSKLWLSGLSLLTDAQIKILLHFQGQYIYLPNVTSVTDEQSRLLLKNKIKIVYSWKKYGLSLDYLAKLLNW